MILVQMNWSLLLNRINEFLDGLENHSGVVSLLAGILQ